MTSGAYSALQSQIHTNTADYPFFCLFFLSVSISPPLTIASIRRRLVAGGSWASSASRSQPFPGHERARGTSPKPPRVTQPSPRAPGTIQTRCCASHGRPMLPEPDSQITYYFPRISVSSIKKIAICLFAKRKRTVATRSSFHANKNGFYPKKVFRVSCDE